MTRKWAKVPKHPNIRCNGKSWRVRVRLPGERRVATFETLEAAVAYRNNVQALSAANRLEREGIVTDRFPLEELWDLFLGDCADRLRPDTVRSYREAGGRLGPMLKGRLVSDLTAEHVRAEMAEWRRAGLSVRTVRYSVGLLGQMLRLGIRERKCRTNVVQQVRLPKPERSIKAVWMDEEYASLIGHVHEAGGNGGDPRACSSRALWIVLWETGLQPQEMCGLLMRNVALAEGVIRIVPTETYQLKNSERERQFPIESAGLLDALKVQLWTRKATGAGPDDLVFVGEDGQRISKDQLRRRLVRCMAAAGIDANGRSPYTFRHTFATRMLKASVPSLILRRMMGHKDARMIDEVYGHLDVSDSRRAIQAAESKRAMG